MQKASFVASVTLLSLTVLSPVPSADAQQPQQPAPQQKPQQPPPQQPAQPRAAAAKAEVATPTDFIIGPEDVLGVVFWREADLTGDYTVRPDGMITLPLIGDMRASGKRPDALKDEITKSAGKYLTEVNVTVVVRQINSRKIFITGNVANPGPYPLTGPRNVMQLIALAGGLTEFADSKNIIIMRTEKGKPMAYRFNYKEVLDRKRLEQNIELKPGDTVVVK